MLSFQLKLLIYIAFLSLGWGLIPGQPLKCLPSLHRKCIINPLDQSPQKQARQAVNLLASAQSSISDEGLKSQPLQQVSPLLKINGLMLFFFATLGSTMPYMPLYYRKIGISGKSYICLRKPIIYMHLLTYSITHDRLTNRNSERHHSRSHFRGVSLVGSPC